MSTVPVSMPQQQRNPLAQNAGVPVLGNTGIKNPNNTLAPKSTLGSVPGGAVPLSGTPAKPPAGATPMTSAAVTAQNNAATVADGTPGTGTPTTGVAPTPGSGAGTAPATTNNPVLAGYTPQQTQQLQKQLVDIYGKGEGNLLFGLINGLGAGNNAYMQAYEKAMAPINAENLATLNTTLGNSGISADSSVFAIANADFQSNVTSQEGLQEQQLQQQDANDLINITESIQGDAQKETASTWYNDLGDVLLGVASVIPGSGAGQALAGRLSGSTARAKGNATLSTAQGQDTSVYQPSSPDTGLPNEVPQDSGTGIAQTSADEYYF